MAYLLSWALGLALRRTPNEFVTQLLPLKGLQHWFGWGTTQHPLGWRSQISTLHSLCCTKWQARRREGPRCLWKAWVACSPSACGALTPRASWLQSQGGCLCINIVISPGLLFHLWTLASKNADLIPVVCLSLKRMALPCRLKWRHSSSNRSGQPLPKLNPKQSLERLQSQRQGSSRRSRLGAGCFLRSRKAARRSAVLLALGNFTLRVGLSLQKGVSYCNVPNQTCLSYLKQALLSMRPAWWFTLCFWILQKPCQAELSETWLMILSVFFFITFFCLFLWKESVRSSSLIPLNLTLRTQTGHVSFSHFFLFSLKMARRVKWDPLTGRLKIMMRQFFNYKAGERTKGNISPLRGRKNDNR